MRLQERDRSYVCLRRAVKILDFIGQQNDVSFQPRKPLFGWTIPTSTFVPSSQTKLGPQVCTAEPAGGSSSFWIYLFQLHSFSSSASGNCDVQSLHSFSSSASGTSFSGIFRPYHFRRLFAWSSMLASQHDCLRNTQASSVRFECCSVDFPEESSLVVLHLVRAQVISVLVFPAAFCMPVRSILPTRLFPPLQVSDSSCCSQVMLLVQLHPILVLSQDQGWPRPHQQVQHLSLRGVILSQHEEGQIIQLRTVDSSKPFPHSVWDE